MKKLLLIGLLIASCSKEEMINCVDNKPGPNGEMMQMVMSKSHYYEDQYEYRLGCEGLYGTLLITTIEYNIGDWVMTHQTYEDKLNQPFNND